MKHRRLDLPGSTRRIASRLLVAALLAPSSLTVTACDRREQPAAAADSANHPGAHAAGDPAAARPPADSAARALGDSAAALDARFQAERTALNAESRRLDSLDRRSADYARRFDAWRLRARAADSLRIARDRLRARNARGR
jgi:hypothetical protein